MTVLCTTPTIPTITTITTITTIPTIPTILLDTGVMATYSWVLGRDV